MDGFEEIHNGKVLLKREQDILKQLRVAGMSELPDCSNIFRIPSTLFFDVGKGRSLQLRSPYAVIAMSKAAGTQADFARYEDDGIPEEREDGYVEVRVNGPYAQVLRDAIAGDKMSVTQP